MKQIVSTILYGIILFAALGIGTVILFIYQVGQLRAQPREGLAGLGALIGGVITVIAILGIVLVAGPVGGLIVGFFAGIRHSKLLEAGVSGFLAAFIGYLVMILIIVGSLAVISPGAQEQIPEQFKPSPSGIIPLLSSGIVAAIAGITISKASSVSVEEK